MSFPVISAATIGSTLAQAQLSNVGNAAASGPPTTALSQLDYLAWMVSEILQNLPATTRVPLGTASTQSIGYGVGAGAAVTQITTASTGVTLSTLSGQITTVTQNIAHGTAVAFTVTNTLVGIHDTVAVNIQSGSNSGNTIAHIITMAAGSYVIQISNLGLSTAETGTLILNVNVTKGAAS